jgi:hypothetical protein
MSLFKINVVLFISVILGEGTAIRLTGGHRFHDYINANEIKVIY